MVPWKRKIPFLVLCKEKGRPPRKKHLLFWTLPKMVDDMVEDMVDMVDNKVDDMVDDMVGMVDNKVDDMVGDSRSFLLTRVSHWCRCGSATIRNNNSTDWRDGVGALGDIIDTSPALLSTWTCLIRQCHQCQLPFWDQPTIFLPTSW